MSKKLKNRITVFFLSLQIIFSLFLPLQPLVSLAQAAENQDPTFSKNQSSITVSNSQASQFSYFFRVNDSNFNSIGTVENGSFLIDLKSQSGEDKLLFDIERLVLKTDLNSYFLELAEHEVNVLKEYQANSLELDAVEENFLLNVWQIDNDARRATTGGAVVLNQEYRFPLNEDVRVTFTKLPEKSSPLSIQEVQLTKEQQQMLGAVSAVAYDITTEMENGSFVFDLVLPKTASNEQVEVKYAESVDELEAAEKTTSELIVSDQEVVIKNLDHMTIFVVTTDDPALLGVACIGAGASGDAGCYNSIQDAINAASSGDTINVAAGVYQEQIFILNKDISLIGAGVNDTFIESPNNLSVSFTTSAANRSVLHVGGGNVTIKNLTIDGLGKGNANHRMMGLSFYNGAGLIDNIRVTRVENSPANGSQSGNAIYAYNNDGVSRSIVVKNSDVDNFQKNGITMNGANLTAEVINNNVSCYGVVDFIAQNGIQFGWGATGTISGNDVNGCSFINPSNLYNRGSAGILLYDVGDNLKVQDNTTTNNDNGIYPSLFGFGLVIQGNAISSNYYGLPVYDNSTANPVLISNNQFSDNVWDLDNYDSDEIDARNNTWSVTDQGDLNQIEAKINHYCVGSSYIHGICNDDDYDSSFGVVRYKNIEIPSNLGWNVSSKTADPGKVPVAISCGGSTNDNTPSHVWSSVGGTNIKYQRQAKTPSGGWWTDPAGYVTTNTPFVWFGNPINGIEGEWNSRVRAYVDVNNNNIPDASEEVSAWSGECKITYDITKPGQVLLNSPATGAYVSGNPIQTWDAINDADHYEYQSARNNSFDPASIIYKTNVGGTRRSVGGNQTISFWWRVRAVDKAGNTGDWSVPFFLNVDNTVPTATITPLLINDKTPALSGTWSDNSGSVSSIEIKVAGQSHSATINGDGTWTLDDNVLAPLSDGTYDVQVIATDLAGNVGNDSTNNELQIDSVAPRATYTHYIDEVLFTGSIAYTNDISKLTFDGAYTDADPSSGLLKDSFVIFDAQEDGSFRFSQNGAKAYCTWRNPANTPFISDNTLSNIAFADCKSVLGEGEYYLAHQVYDNAIRWDIPSITQFRDVLGLHFVIDQTPPTSAINVPTDSTLITNNWDGTVAGTANDNISGVDYVELEITYDSDAPIMGLATGALDSSGQYNWTYSLPDEPKEGTYTITSHAVDLAGNRESSYTITIIFDKTIPEVDLTIDPANPDGKNGWYKTQPTITLNATDPNLDKVEYQWNSKDGTWTIYTGPIKPTTEGRRVLYYRATDLATNVSKIGVKNLAWDQTELTQGPLKVEATPKFSGGPDAKVTWEAATDNVGIDHYKVTFDLLDGDADFSENVASHVRELTTNRLTEAGTWKIIVTAYDGAGHEKSASDEIVVDKTAPVVPVGGGNLVVEGFAEAPEVLGDNTEPSSSNVEEKPVGEVLGVTSCNPWINSLWWVLLLVQLVGLFVTEYLWGKKRQWLKFAIYVAAGAASVGLVRYLVNVDCLSGGFTTWLVRYYFVTAAVTLMLTKLISYLLIEREE